MKIKLLLYTIAFASICSCGVKSEYEQEARTRAITAAQALLSIDYDNTMKVERLILDAKAIQSEYLLLGDTVAVQAFDTAFREYVSANDSVLAQEIFKQY